MTKIQQTHTIAQAVQGRGQNNNRAGRGGEFNDVLNNITSNDTQTSRQDNTVQQTANNQEANDRPHDNAQTSQNTQTTQNAEGSYNPQPQEAQETAVQEVYNAEYAEYIPVDMPIIDIVVDEDALLAEMAAALGITIEQLVQLIEQLDMPIEELLEADNRLELLMAAKGLDDKAQLLVLPEALPAVQKMAQAVETYVTVTTYANPLMMEADAEAELTPETMLTAELTEASEAEVTQTATLDAFELPEMQATSQASDVAIQNVAQATQIENAPVTVAPIAIDAPVQAQTAQTADVAAPVPTGQAVTPQNIVNQIVTQARIFTGEGMTEMRIKLNPAHLGDLSMRIATINGIVTAQFIAESSRVKELIEAGLNTLRDSLEEAGIIIQDVEVNVRGEGGYQDFEAEEASITDARIRDIMTQAELLEGEGEPEEVMATEESVVDYRI